MPPPSCPDVHLAPVATRYRLAPGSSGSADSPLADEALLALAARQPVARIWHADQGLVVPRTYAARPGFAAAQADLAARGWPVHVRQSGGGIVPQGPGILDVSLAQSFHGRPLDHADALYRHLCYLLQAALRHFGIATSIQPVQGSFCDGRYNLAIGTPARKVVGTAQLWRRVPGGSSAHQIGLVHALILAQCDPAEATRQANALEAALGSARRYRSECVASLDQVLPAAMRGTAIARGSFAAALRQELVTRLDTWPPLADAPASL